LLDNIEAASPSLQVLATFQRSCLAYFSVILSVPVDCGELTSTISLVCCHTDRSNKLVSAAMSSSPESKP
jgi:hypothetical protein